MQVRSWQIQARTCYACARCQPLAGAALDQGVSEPADASAPALFNSHCAGESLEERLLQPQKLRVAELRAALQAAGLPVDGRKAALVERLTNHQAQLRASAAAAAAAGSAADDAASAGPGVPALAVRMRSARAAAADKAAVHESRAVEHIAEDEELLEEGAPEWLEFPAEDEPPDDLDDDVQAAILASVAAAPPSVSRKRAPAAPASEESTPGAEGKRAARAAGKRTKKEP